MRSPMRSLYPNALQRSPFGSSERSAVCEVTRSQVGTPRDLLVRQIDAASA